jgi:hypothetical protein
VWHFTSRHNIIEFVEVEYRPHGPHNYPRSKYLLEQKRDTELQNLNSRQPSRRSELAKNMLSKVLRSQIVEDQSDENTENAIRVDAAEFV